MHSRSSLENPTRFQTKMGEMYTRFQTKTAQKKYPLGQHILPAYIREYPPTLPSVCATKCTHCFSPDLKSDMSGYLFQYPYIFSSSAVKYNC